MRVLFDEQLPRQTGAGADGTRCATAALGGTHDGELLRRAADDGFEVLVTADQNLEFQQNLAGSRLGVIVLIAPSNALEDLLPLVPNLLATIPTSRPGHVLRVHA